MKKLISLSFAVLFSIVAFCQGSNTDQNFQKGKKAYKSEEYQKALAYLSLSIGDNSTSAAYYYRSMTYNQLGDSCNSCKDLRTAAFINEKEYGKLFEQKCSITTLVQNVPDHIKILYPDVNKLKITSYICDSDTLLVGIIGEEPNASEIEIRSLRNSTKADNNEVYTIVEDMPIFPGGDDARNRFLAMNIVYPESATRYGIQGTVYVQFIIDQNGIVTDAKILKGIGGGCDEESLRVVKLMPKWYPGKQNGKVVNVLFNMPIYFKLGGWK